MLLVAILAAGCGGGSSESAPCNLGAAVGCGGTVSPPPPSGSGNPPTPADPALKVASVSLVASSSELPSSSLPGTEVTLTALLKTADNVAVSGAKVEFSADSGFLAVSNATSDASGKVSATLGTGGSKQNRPIKVSVKAGNQATSTTVAVTGTHFSFSAPGFVALGSTTSVTATLLDSADRPIAGEAVSASVKGANNVTLALPATDARGQVPVLLNAKSRGTDEITVSALGASATRPFSVTGSDVTLQPSILVDSNGGEVLRQVNVGACAQVDGAVAVGGAGSVSLSTSRGTLYQDAACTQPLAGAQSYSGGTFPHAWIKSDNIGVASIDAVIGNGSRGSTRVEFIAPLTASARVNLQSDQAVVGSGERSTLIAVVRDGTTANNLVKGATVQFSILADPSGGALLSPISSVTGSDGVARVVFQAGAGDTAKDGTLVQARIAEVPSATSTTKLTVNKKALSIQFGTGNKVIVISQTVLQKDFAVFVSDSAGNPVKDVAVTAAAWPTLYMKGGHKWVPDNPPAPTPGHWEVNPTVTCPNEDVQRKGLYESVFDINGNGMLDPGIPLSITSGGKTDAMGLTTISLRYPADRAHWVLVELTVTGTVAGTESLARSTYWLGGLSDDYTDYNIDPPGKNSPYGTSASCAFAY